MPLLTIGSAAYDTLETPFGFRERSLGGSGVYASFAASFFTESRLIGVVGGDWKPEYSGLLRSRGVDLEGLETRENEKTTYWSGRYFDDMNQRETLLFEGNVMNETYIPIVPDSYKNTPYVFLGNGSPVTDVALLDSIAKPKLVVADTMDFYINGMKKELLDLLTKIDGLIVNDGEATLLTGERNFLFAAKKILELGPKFVVIKRGEYGASYISANEIYLVPAYPTMNVVDPTGAGDAFAGAFMGSLAESGDLSAESVKTALLYATVVASLNVEGFSLERFQFVTRAEIDKRAAEFRKILV
ncbi:MAG: sugar kinase [Thermoguttaceae bacterium]|nr:sugar kinase [Thermoguttaceae bacterium]